MLFNKNDTGVYLEKTILSPDASLSFSGFGFSSDAGNTEWAIVGAPESDSNKGYATAINRTASDGSFALYRGKGL